MYSKAKLDTFKTAYFSNVKTTMREHPQLYRAGMSPEYVVDKTMSWLDIGGVKAISITDAKAWIATAKQFGIKNTYKAWHEWFLADVETLYVELTK